MISKALPVFVENKIISFINSTKHGLGARKRASQFLRPSDPCSEEVPVAIERIRASALEENLILLWRSHPEDGWNLQTVTLLGDDVQVLLARDECRHRGQINAEHAELLMKSGPFGVDTLFGLIRSNVKIDTETIAAIGNPCDPDLPGWTIAHDLAARRQLSILDATSIFTTLSADGWSPLDILLGHLPNKRTPSVQDIREKLKAGRVLMSGEWTILGATPEGRELLQWVSVWHQWDLSYAEIVQTGNPVFVSGMAETFSFVELAFDNLFRLDVNQNQIIRMGNPNSLAQIAASNGVVFSLCDILRLNNPRDDYGCTLAHVMAQAGNFLSIEDLILFGNPADVKSVTVAHEMAMHGYDFSVEQIMELGNPADKNGVTLAHICAASGGQRLSVEDILELGNPANFNGETVAHASAKAGRGFTPEEIRRLNDPRDLQGASIQMAMAQSIHPPTVEDLLVMGNMPDHTGWTPAHMIALTFRKYHNQPLTVSELVWLGNPPDGSGVTPAHVQASAGYFFDINELIILRNPADQDGNTVAHYIVQADINWFGGNYHGRNIFSEDDLICIGNPANNAGETVQDYQKKIRKAWSSN